MKDGNWQLASARRESIELRGDRVVGLDSFGKAGEIAAKQLSGLGWITTVFATEELGGQANDQGRAATMFSREISVSFPELLAVQE